MQLSLLVRTGVSMVATAATVIGLVGVSVATAPSAANAAEPAAAVAAVTSDDHPRIVSFTTSNSTVTENAPYATLTAMGDRAAASGYVLAVYDDRGDLAFSCSGVTRCEGRIRPGLSESRVYIAYVVGTTPPTTGGPPATTYSLSTGVRVTNTGWVAPASFESFEASARSVTENAPYATLQAKLDTSLPSEFKVAVYDDTGALVSNCSTSSKCEVRVRPALGQARTYTAHVVLGEPPATGGPGQSYVSSDPIAVTNTGWVAPASFESFEASARSVTENAPYATLQAKLDTSLPSEFKVAVYDDTGALVSNCSTSSKCEVRVRPALGQARTYTAHVVLGEPPATGGPGQSYVSSDPIAVTNTGWVAPASFESFEASARSVTENAPYATLQAKLDTSLPSEFKVAVYDDTGALVSNCSTSSKCEVRVRPALGQARTYTAHVVLGEPPATGGPGQSYVSSDPITVTNKGWDANAEPDGPRAIDSVTVLSPVVRANYPYATIAVDTNNEKHGLYVAVYDDENELVGRCASGYGSDFNTCTVSALLEEGETHSYSAYLTTGDPEKTGPPSTAVAGPVQSGEVTGQGWGAAGRVIDSVTVLSPVVRANYPYATIAVDTNNEKHGLYVAVYDDENELVGRCASGYGSDYNTCTVSALLEEGETHSYSAYLTTGDPEKTGPPSTAVAGPVQSGEVTGQGWGAAGRVIDSVTVLSPVVRANYPYATIAVDTNNEKHGLYVAVYDDENELVGRCASGYGSDFNTCTVTPLLEEGETHSYSAYLTTGDPEKIGPPSTAVAGPVQSGEVTGRGPGANGRVIDAVTITTPVVRSNYPYAYIAVDTNNEEHGGLFVAVYDRSNKLVGRCAPGYQSEFNTCVASGNLAADETQIYTAYLTTGDPELTGPPTTAVAGPTSSSGVAISSGPTSAAESAGGSNPSENCTDACTGDPINTRTGEFWETSVDLQLSNVGAPMQVSRTFSTTRKNTDIGLGYGWSMPISMRITAADGPSGAELSDAETVEVHQENGSTLVFARDADGTYSAPARVLATLSSDADGGFTFVRRQREVYTFSPRGDLTRVADRNDQGYNVVRGPDGRVSQIDAGSGVTFSLDWANGRLASITDSAARRVAYQYSSAGDLIAVERPDGSTLAYAYDSAHRITEITAATGGKTTNAYDDHDRVTKQVDSVGGEMTFAYAPDSTTVTAPDGSVTIYRYAEGQLRSQTTAAGTAVEATTTYVYGTTNQVVSETNPLGHSTWFTHDDRGNVTSVTDPIGRSTQFTYDNFNNPTSRTDPTGATTSATYDSRGNLTSTTDATGSLTTFVINDDGTVASSTDALGRTTSFTYDERGNLATATDPTGATTTTDIDAPGRVLSLTDARGGVTTYAYDAAGRILSTTDAGGGVTTATYDEVGNRLTVTAADGAVTSWEYDLAGRTTASVDPGGARTTYTYDPAGRVATVTDAMGAVQASAYDAAGRLRSSTDALDRTTSYTWDDAGRLIATTLPSGATTVYTYDLAGQQTAVTDARGSASFTSYDAAGRPVTSTDAEGRSVTTAYDAAGRVTSVTRGDGSVLSWAYDAAGQQTGYTDAAGASTTYSYDAAGRMTARTDQAHRVTTSSYDAVGNLISTTTPDGNVVARSYDALARLTSVSYPSDTPDVAYEYDAVGRRVSMTDGTGTTTYAYDSAGRVTSIVGPGATVGYSWDELGQLRSLRYPDGTTVIRDYDAAGQPSSITDWGGRAYEFTWTQDGQMASLTYPNGVTTRTEHDETGAVTEVSVSHNGGSALVDLAYTYTDAGLQESTTVERAETRTLGSEFTWDPQARIASITGSLAGEVSFTAADQVATMPDGTTLAYDAAGQLTTATSAAQQTTFAYDQRGNRTAETSAAGSRNFSYDTADRLTALTDSGEKAWTYSYNGDGLRASSTRTDADGTVTSEQFTWDPSGPVPLLLADGDHSYLYGAGTAPIAQTGGDGTVFLHSDVIGSVRSVTDEHGEVIAEADYAPYGAVLVDAETTAVASVTRFGFAGEYTDVSGLIYLRARYYDPTTGQFTSVDQLRDLTMNLYGYTGGNPLQFVDPLGLTWWNPLSWTGDTYDVIAASASAVALGSGLVAGGSLATVVGAPVAAAAGTVAVVAEGVAVVASVGGTVQHLRAGEGYDALVSATGIVPGVGMATRALYEARYAGRAIEYGTRVAGDTWRQIAQGVEAGTLWGSGMGQWLQNWLEWSDLSATCGR